MKHLEDMTENHPNPLDRNRVILLCRDLLVINDWIILACKMSSLAGKIAPGDASELLSIAVLGSGERILLDVVVRPDGAVSSGLLKMHGCKSAHVFNAPAFTELHKVLHAGFAKTRVLCWSPAKVKSFLDRITSQENLPELKAEYIDFQAEFSAFVGEKGNSESGYKMQALPRKSDSSCVGVPPLAECKLLLKLVQSMAGSSQHTDSAIIDKKWSAAFYKPKLGPTEKIKEMLGIQEDRR